VPATDAAVAGLADPAVRRVVRLSRLVRAWPVDLLLSGSLTNLLIAERAERMGVRLTFLEYARAGIPICRAVAGVLRLSGLDLTHTLPLTPVPTPPIPATPQRGIRQRYGTRSRKVSY